MNAISKDEAAGWAALLGRTAQGDLEAFEEFYGRSAAWSLALSTELVGAAAAEEFMNGLYVVVWREAASFDAERATPQHWLGMLARRLAQAA